MPRPQVTTTLAAALLALALTLQPPAADGGFVSTSGTKILDENGEELFFSGINLGNWLVWEGYLMMGDFNYRTHTQFFNELSDALGGSTKAAEFEYQWRLNYVDEQAILDLSNLGFNSVRVPFNYKLFYYNGQIVDDGFEFFDRVIAWCRTYGMYVLLDMHGVPGYQNPGDHSDNVDSNADQPRDTVKFWDGDNIQLAASIWKHIANRYADEPVVWGYDLINEPVPQSGREYELLPSFVTMRNAIREVDNNHIIVVEGSWWGSDLTKIDWMDQLTQSQTGISSQWDDKLVYQIHHYGPPSDTYGREQITNKLGIPLFIGEYGESNENDLLTITNWAKQTLEGYFPWSFKKMSHDRTLWTIPLNNAYNQVKAYINNGGSAPTHLYNDMISFAQTNIKNGHSSHEWHQSFFDAIKPSITCSNTAGFPVPGQIQAEEYCAHQGVQLETTTDSGGGQNIGFLDSGDYTEYNIDVSSSGQYRFSARVASQYSSGRLDVQVDGTSLAVLSIPNTNGWQSFTTISTNLFLAAGTHRMRLAFPDGNFNINWVSFSVSLGDMPTNSPTSTPQTGCNAAASFSVPGKIEAEHYCDEYGIQLENTSDAGDGQNIAFLDSGDYAEYNIQVSASGQYALAARVASDWNTGQMDVKVDGTVLASFSIPNTSGWQSFVTIAQALSLASGTHRLRLEFPGGGFNLNWMSFSVVPGSAPTKSPTASPSKSPTIRPTRSPTASPTKAPTPAPTSATTVAAPTTTPTPAPTKAPTKGHTQAPTNVPTTASPTKGLTHAPPVTVPAGCGLASSFPVPGYIQAEQYCGYQGVELETTTDIGGGQHIFHIDNGEYVEYNIEVDANNMHTFAARVQSPTYSGQINLQVDGASVLWLSIPHTNGDWQTISANVSLNAGMHRLRVAFPQGGFKMNWIAFTAGANNSPPLPISSTPAPTASLLTKAPTKGPTASPTKSPTIGSTSMPTKKLTPVPTTLPTSSPTRHPSSNPPAADCNSASSFAVPGLLLAAQYCDHQGVELEATTDEGGGQNIFQIDDGDFVEYKIDVTLSGQYTFAARVESPIYSGQINLQVDGISVLWLSVPHTSGGWRTIWANVRLNAGIHRLRVAIPQGGFKVNWMLFNAGDNNPP